MIKLLKFRIKHSSEGKVFKLDRNDSYDFDDWKMKVKCYR